MSELPDINGLMLDRQLPDFVTSYEFVSTNGRLIREVSEHLLHWTALQFEKYMPIGYPLDQLDLCEDERVRRLDSFIQTITINTQVNGLMSEEIARIHRVITADDGAVMAFVHSLVQYLHSRWDRGALDKAAAGVLSSASHWSESSTDLGMDLRCPGWVTPNEANLWIKEIYWMAPVVFLQVLEYGDIRRRLAQLQSLSPYPPTKPPKTSSKRN